MPTQKKVYEPYHSPSDPCRPIRYKTYETPPQLYYPVQPADLPQYDPYAALKHGTLWPVYYSPYDGRVEGKASEVHE